MWDWLLPTLAGGALRFAFLGAWSMWADEVSTLEHARDLGQVAGYPLGYLLIGAVVRVLGSSEFAARLVPAIAGTLTIPLLFHIGRRAMDRGSATWAAWLLALSPMHLYHSQLARYYTLVALFSLVAAYAVFRGIEGASTRSLIGALIAVAVAFLTHWSALWLVGAAACYTAWRWVQPDRPQALTWRHAAVLFGPFVLGGIALSPWFLRFLRGWGPWGLHPTAMGLLALKLADRFDPGVLLLAALAAWIGLRARRPFAVWLACFAGVPLVGTFLLGGASHGGSRFALVGLAPCLLLAGFGAATLRRTRRRLALVAVAWVVLGLVVKDGIYFFVEHGQRPRWREAVAFVRDQPGDTLVVAALPPVVRYYGGQAQDLTSLRRLHRAEALLDVDDRDVWFIVERTRNVRPPPELDTWIRCHAVLAACFPVHVRALDYSIDVWRIARTSPNTATKSSVTRQNRLR